MIHIPETQSTFPEVQLFNHTPFFYYEYHYCVVVTITRYFAVNGKCSYENYGKFLKKDQKKTKTV